MYRATRDRAYLDDAYKWYVAHGNEEGQLDQRLLVDWDNVAWPTTLLLAQLTDDANFHTRFQDFLSRWICTSSVVSYTDLGRAFNHYDPKVPTTMNVAMLSAIYGQAIAPNASIKAWMPQKYSHAVKSQRYTCWTRKQMRCVLGDHAASRIVGVGSRYPLRPADRAACLVHPPYGSGAPRPPASSARTGMDGAVVDGPKAPRPRGAARSGGPAAL